MTNRKNAPTVKMKIINVLKDSFKDKIDRARVRCNLWTSSCPLQGVTEDCSVPEAAFTAKDRVINKNNWSFIPNSTYWETSISKITLPWHMVGPQTQMVIVHWVILHPEDILCSCSLWKCSFCYTSLTLAWCSTAKVRARTVFLFSVINTMFPVRVQ